VFSYSRQHLRRVHSVARLHCPAAPPLGHPVQQVPHANHARHGAPVCPRPAPCLPPHTVGSTAHVPSAHNYRANIGDRLPQPQACGMWRVVGDTVLSEHVAGDIFESLGERYRCALRRGAWGCSASFRPSVTRHAATQGDQRAHDSQPL
jgi:hypothetical protein